MTSVQEQYAESLRSSQAAVVQAMESWTKSAQSAFSPTAPDAAVTVSPEQVIDQVFDFAEQMLEMQRKFAKSLATQAAEAAAKAAKSS
jgi:acetyl-CoA carboxylase carboxyltransferase component